MVAKQKLFGFTYQLENDRQAYYFVAVTQVKEILLRNVLKHDEAFCVTDFGQVIASGYGTPPEDLITDLKKKWWIE